MASVKNIVRVANVTKTFQLGKIDVQALKGVDLEIAAGQYVSIMGPSGSGKTTLCRRLLSELEGLAKSGVSVSAAEVKRVVSLLRDAPDIELVCINEIEPLATCAYLFQYDSVFGPWPGEVRAGETCVVIGGGPIGLLIALVALGGASLFYAGRR